MLIVNGIDLIDLNDELDNLFTRIKFAQTLTNDIFQVFETDKPDSFRFISNYESTAQKTFMVSEFLTDAKQICDSIENVINNAIDKTKKAVETTTEI